MSLMQSNLRSFADARGIASATGRIRCFDAETGRARNLVECAPILSSKGTGWESIFFERYNLPEGEMHRHTLLQHTISVPETAGTPVDVVVNGKFHHTRAEIGTVWFQPADTTMHMSRRGRPSDIILIGLGSVFFENLARDLPHRDTLELIPASGIADYQLYHIALALKSELMTGCLSGRMYEEALATAIAIHLIDHYATRRVAFPQYSRGLSPYRLRRAIEYIEQHLDQDLSITDLACIVEISPYHFSRMFKQSTGVPPHRYLLLKRIERSKELLSNRDLPIVEVCQAVGFQNQSHFCAAFHKIVGVTPTGYRASGAPLVG